MMVLTRTVQNRTIQNLCWILEPKFAKTSGTKDRCISIFVSAPHLLCCVCTGGFYYPNGLLNYDEYTNKKPKPPHTSALHDLYQSHVDSGCASANTGQEYMCGPANVGFLFPYIKVTSRWPTLSWKAEDLSKQPWCKKRVMLSFHVAWGKARSTLDNARSWSWCGCRAPSQSFLEMFDFLSLYGFWIVFVLVIVILNEQYARRSRQNLNLGLWEQGDSGFNWGLMFACVHAGTISCRKPALPLSDQCFCLLACCVSADTGLYRGKHVWLQSDLHGTWMSPKGELTLGLSSMLWFVKLHQARILRGFPLAWKPLGWISES